MRRIRDAEREVQNLLARLAAQPALWRAFCSIVALAIAENREWISADSIIHKLRERGFGSFLNDHVAIMSRLWIARNPDKPNLFRLRPSKFDGVPLVPKPGRQSTMPFLREPPDWASL